MSRILRSAVSGAPSTASLAPCRSDFIIDPLGRQSWVGDCAVSARDDCGRGLSLAQRRVAAARADVASVAAFCSKARSKALAAADSSMPLIWS